MKKSMMMLLAAGLLGFSTASAETDTKRPAEADTAFVRGAMCNPPVNGQNGGASQWQQNRNCPGPGAQQQQMRKAGRRGMNCGPRGLQQQLGLNDRQSEQIEKLQQKHFERMAADRQELATLNRDLQSESLKSRPDRNKINQLSERIGTMHAARAKEKSTHMMEVAAVLNSSQRNEMQKMMDNRPMRGNCGSRCQ
ncbi:MAG: periplasmic heavy metal sensor [Chlorobiaceae bacterium]|nr:periplasmic heavy metal sensor [Chlorobiaceae bacterium]